MTVYQEYLHLLLIKTSDKFIQERYKDFMNKVNMGKSKKFNFFERMDKDVRAREEMKKGIEDTKTDQGSLFRRGTKMFSKKASGTISDTKTIDDN